MKKKMQKKERVYWDEYDRKDILDLVFPMIMKKPDQGLIPLVNKAIAQMPQEKQRKILGVSSVGWLVKDIRNRFKELQEASGQTYIQTIVERVNIDLDHIPMEDLAAAFFKRMFKENKQIKDSLSAIQGKIFSNGSTKEIEKKEIKKKKCVTIIGLLTEQQVHIDNSHGYDLEILHLNASSEKFMPKGTDYVIVAVKFRPESWINAMVNQIEKERIFTCDGGLAKLKLILDNIIKLK